MKALSLWEPWASLIATGAKRFETRSWSTSYQGPLLICAAKKGLSYSELNHYLAIWEFQRGLAPLLGHALNLSADNWTWAGVGIENLQFGNAVAIVELEGCIPTEELTLGECGTDWPFGDFSGGRFAWRLRLVEKIEPFPVRGAQGLFEVQMRDCREPEQGLLTDWEVR